MIASGDYVGVNDVDSVVGIHAYFKRFFLTRTIGRVRLVIDSTIARKAV